MNKNEASQLLKQLAPDGIVYDKDLSDFEFPDFEDSECVTNFLFEIPWITVH